MASATSRTTSIRKKKLAGKGRRRKATVRRVGTTQTVAQLFGEAK